MKKILVTILSLILVLSCFACGEKEKENDIEFDDCSRLTVYCDVYVRDAEGVDKCLWEDGEANFRDRLPTETPTQTKKSAVLHIGVEYDMCFYQRSKILDFVSKYKAEFDCDKEIFEITENPEKENHFILKVLQACASEKIIVEFPLRDSDPIYNGNHGKIIFAVTTEEE